MDLQSKSMGWLQYDRDFPLSKKWPYPELFWSVFSRIRTEYGEILRIMKELNINIKSLKLHGEATVKFQWFFVYCLKSIELMS